MLEIIDYNVVFFCVILVAALAVTIGRVLYFYLIELKKWQTVPGEIMASEIKYKEDKDGDGGYGLHICYQYEVDSETHQSDQFTKNIRVRANASWHDEKRRKYPIGKKVTVFYNPKKPQDAIIEKQFDYETLYLALAIFGIIALCYFA